MKSETDRNHFAVISYIPALHRGYIDFFKKYSGGALYILSADFVRETPRMDRDIRALAPEEARAAIAALGIFASVEVLDEDKLEKLLAGGPLVIVMPDDEVNRQFAEAHLMPHLPKKTAPKIEFVPAFLRWDRKISTAEFGYLILFSDEVELAQKKGQGLSFVPDVRKSSNKSEAPV